MKVAKTSNGLVCETEEMITYRSFDLSSFLKEVMIMRICCLV